jgi:hypothetical protein
MVVLRVVATVPGGSVMPIRIEGVGEYHVQVPAGTAVGEAFDFELQLPTSVGVTAGGQHGDRDMPVPGRAYHPHYHPRHHPRHHPSRRAPKNVCRDLALARLTRNVCQKLALAHLAAMEPAMHSSVAGVCRRPRCRCCRWGRRRPRCRCCRWGRRRRAGQRASTNGHGNSSTNSQGMLKRACM